MTNHMNYDPGSFRDRESRVFHREDGIFRGLSKRALTEWEMLSSTGFFPRLMAKEKLIQTERIDSALMPKIDRDEDWAAILRHQTIPFVSYPYEWSFGMLKDAALLQLELMQAALDEGMILKDASAFNFQWMGANPVFIDIPSFEKWRQGEPWVGYRQFCQMFLYPLFLQAYKDIPFQPWLRGGIDGISAEHCKNLMSPYDLLRPGVLTHVYLHSKMQAKHAQTQKNVKGDLRAAGFNKDLIKANVNRLRKVIRGLIWKRTRSEWADYVDITSYTDIDREAKIDFVRDIVISHSWNLVWDLGCNTGAFSRIAAENARYVVAMDADPLSIERLYQALKSEGNTAILPLISNIADPSPNLGWRGQERKALSERGRPDLILCLALIHHLVINNNIPVRNLIGWLANLGTSVVIEFVTKEDRMVRTLLRNREDNYADYEINYFESCLSESFSIIRRETLKSGTRILYFAQKKWGI